VKKAPRPDTPAATGSELEPAISDLPAVVPPEAKAALVAIEQSQLGGRMKRALILVAKGASVRDAATAEDYATHSDVYRLARKFHLVDLRTKAIVDTHRSVAKLSSGLLEDRLLDDPKTFSGAQLGVISGIATDKVLLHEKSKTDDGSAYLSALEKMAAGFAASGAGLELKVTVSPAAVAAGHVIDVTPTEAN